MRGSSVISNPVTAVFSIAMIFLLVSCGSGAPGIFVESTDIGSPILPGSTRYRASSDTYVIEGGGADLWADADAFRFTWKEVNGDLSMSADVAWEDNEGHERKKAGLMIRAGLEPDDPYVDAATHANGLIAIQYRMEKGGQTAELQTAARAPARMRFERTANIFSLFVADSEGVFQPAASIEIPLEEQALAGLFVSAHDAETTETATFSNVALEESGTVPEEQRVVESTLEIINIETGLRRIVYRAKDHFEAPNWSRDGSFLLFNQDGRLYKMPVEGGAEPEMLDTGFADRCNNDHGFSMDGTQLAISHGVEGEGSIIFVLPAEGGTPVRVTDNGPSYWHGWSPDGERLAYCARRGDNYDVYTISVNGGPETRLTAAEGLDDGPDYSPDGRYIYFNSVRSGLMKIWRMNTDGSDQTQMTFGEEYNDWFAHPSDDGRRLVMISYDNSVPPGSHPPNKNVALRLMSADGGEPRTIARFFGGQGTINVPSWSPDSKEFAFVSYRLVRP